MKLSIIVLSLVLSSNVFSDELSQFCQSQIYAKIDKSLPADEFLSNIIPTDKENVFVLELTKDMGDDNYCLKEGEVTVEGISDVCRIKEIKISTENYDCG